MKRLTFVAMVLLFLLVAVSFSFANTSEIELYLNDEKVSFNDQPQLSNDRVYVPLRGIFEAFEAQVEWNDATQTVTAVKGDTEIKVTIGSKSAKKNGTNIMLEAVPYLSQKRTYVPLRFVGEAFGAHVNWDGNTKAISIVTAGDLPVVGSFETLKKLLKENADMRQSYLYNGINEAVSDAAVKSVDRVELKSEAASSPEHSETNVQVQGVDEADIVKTDGEYLYQVSNQQIVISRIFPADELEVRNVIGFEPRGIPPVSCRQNFTLMTII